MIWIHEMVMDKPKRYHAIRCFTCEQNLANKTDARKHRGHSVHYVDKNGEIDEK